ncbi:hypothetical protein Cni_G06692 [Canna indica]|uniref:DUF761 domain-containing protein n=1 Tax=Canna indica TaxID=4628 RepID=A0AAQ3JX33_9LILI|nr:hypothetical protein Cni_G06692 [Canna indica]
MAMPREKFSLSGNSEIAYSPLSGITAATQRNKGSSGSGTTSNGKMRSPAAVAFAKGGDGGPRRRVASLKAKTAEVIAEEVVEEEKDINEVADAFIKRFREQLQLQRLRSIENYNQMLARGL